MIGLVDIKFYYYYLNSFNKPRDISDEKLLAFMLLSLGMVERGDEKLLMKYIDIRKECLEIIASIENKKKGLLFDESKSDPRIDAYLNNYNFLVIMMIRLAQVSTEMTNRWTKLIKKKHIVDIRKAKEGIQIKQKPEKVVRCD
jgi:hypothetical protein